MRLSAVVVTLIYSSCCAVVEANAGLRQRKVENKQNAPRDTSSTCSLGIGRVMGRVLWDVTVYNVPQSQRQDVNIIQKVTNQQMDKGQSITISTSIQDLKITNIDNAPVLPYDEPELVAPINNPTNGLTKVELQFQVGSANFTTKDCSPGNLIFTGGRESWSCDFACTLPSAKEL